jgi:endonuclease YncB( thermonuclease family)
MKPRVIIGIPISVVVVLVITSQFGGGSETNVMPIATEIDDVTDVLVFDGDTDDLNCLGTAKCFTGIVTEIIDGDTLKVNGESIRFSLASVPEFKGHGGVDSKNFIETICPVGSTVTVDEDDGYVIGSYGRMVGLIHCNDVNLSSELLDSTLGYLEDRFCDSSEFAKQKWAQKHGCE